MIGSTISHYKILEKLGEGGMGVVYKAHDTKLNRDVALKFLPHGVSAHEPERSRFLQEAQAAAALNHPNICTIYDITQEGDDQFIVMEYVDGKTLRGIIQSAVSNQQAAITYAIQVGEALEEAHSKGIVHRDIKLDNIMVNSKNQIKVMDFGLAKLKGSMKLTKTSSTVGTLAYMAPEQLQGGEVDARSDIFSFGVVLYEMLTGHLPFRGEHEAAVMYSIINEEATPIQKYLPDVSSELVHVLNRALEKDPEDRYQSVHDMVIDFRRLKKQTSRVSRVVAASELSEGVISGPQKSSRHGRKILLSLLVGVAVVVAGVVALLFRLRGPELNPTMTFRTLHIPYKSVWYAGVSGDGNWVAFPATDEKGKYDVYMMNIAQAQPKRITYDSSNSIFGVSISPDAGTILYSRRKAAGQEPEIVSIPSLGGMGRVILEKVEAVDWHPDGSHLCYLLVSNPAPGLRTHEFWTASPDGSNRHFEFADTMRIRAVPRFAWSWSPDGKSIAWTRNFPGGYTEIIIRNMKTGEERQLTFDKKIADDPHWIRNDLIIFDSNRGGNVNLWVVSSSGGEPEQLTRGSGPDVPLWISADCQRMIYSEAQNMGHVKIANLLDGSVHQLTVDERPRWYASISPNGTYVAFVSKDENEFSLSTDIYLTDRQGKETRKMTSGPGTKTFPCWSRDGKWITYSAFLPSEPSDSARIYLLNVDNPVEPKCVGKGLSAYWYDEKHFVVWEGRKSFIGSTESNDLIAISPDSTWVCPAGDGRYYWVNDLRASRRGMWLVSKQSFDLNGLVDARLIVKQGLLYPTFAVKTNTYFYTELTGNRLLHRVSYPSGKDERTRFHFPGLRSFFTVRDDGTEIAYADTYRKTRFVVIENLFK